MTNISAIVGQRLGSLFKEQDGCVERRYSVPGILDYLDFANTLKPSAHVRDGLAAAAAIFFGDEGRDLVVDLRNGKHPMPGARLLRSSRIRLDLMTMRYQQMCFVRFSTLHYMLIDSSPQLGLNFLIVLEDIIKVPEPCTVNLLRRCQLDLNMSWETVLQSLSSLGYGRSGVVKTSVQTSNLHLMGVETMDQFDDKRQRYKGMAVDQGTESGLCDMTVDVVPSKRGAYHPDDPMNFLFPWMLSIADFLHILWGAFETACKNNPLFTEFEAALKAVIAVTSDTQLMRKARALLIPRGRDAEKAFSTKATVAIDWRWETMCKALDIVVPIWPFLLLYWNVDAMASSDSVGSKLDSRKIRDLDKVFLVSKCIKSYNQ